jgi:S-formylglutathione hydrolase FrmB
MPSDSLFGIGSGYLPRPEEDAERWIIDEVQAAVRLKYPTAGAGGVSIAGLSMGGWGALRLAARHPGAFRAAVGMSPLTKLEHVAGYAVERHRSEHAPPAEDPELLALITRQADRMPPFRITCGTEDALLPAVRALHQGLTESRVPHQYDEAPGAHEWNVWEAELERSLIFMDSKL